VKKGKFVPKFVTGKPTAKAQRTPSSMSPSRGGERGRNEKILYRKIIFYNKITKVF